MSTERGVTAGALRVASALLLVGAGLGALLRFVQLRPIDGLHVGNAVHAHSHTLYFGWAGLALFALMFERVGASARVVLGALAMLGVATFPVFLLDGYGRAGVILSAASVVPFGAAVVVFWRAASAYRTVDVSFLRLGAVFVVFAYVAALSRVAFQVVHVDSPVVGAIVVHLFLGCFGAFFVVSLMGLVVRATGDAQPVLRWVLRFAPLAPLPSLLVVPGIDETPLGSMSRVAAVLMLVPASAWCWWARRHDVVLRSAAFAWWLSVALLAAVAVDVLPALPLQRHAVVAVIHLQTLGVVTTTLFWLFERRRASSRLMPVLVHQVAASTLLSGLMLAALGPARVGLIVAALGGTLTWCAQAWVAVRHFSR